MEQQQPPATTTMALWFGVLAALAASAQQIPHSSPGLLILGLGNVGSAVLHQAKGDFQWVRGTKRSNPQNSHHVLLFSSVVDFITTKTNNRISHVLTTIPPPSNDNDGTMTDVMNTLSARLPPDTWVGVVSTTSVYGNHDGGWVREESPLLCDDSNKYVAFEEEWKQLADECRWKLAVFRCAGLYGPKRSALHTLWKRGYRNFNSTEKNDDGVTNRIHEIDVARAIVSAMRKHATGTYNLADDLPEKRSVVMRHAFGLFEAFNLSMNQETEAASSSSTRTSNRRSSRRGRETKLVSNKRMKEELFRNNQLFYPTYREGLNTIFHDRTSPWWKGQ